MGRERLPGLVSFTATISVCQEGHLEKIPNACPESGSHPRTRNGSLECEFHFVLQVNKLFLSIFMHFELAQRISFEFYCRFVYDYRCELSLTYS